MCSRERRLTSRGRVFVLTMMATFAGCAGPRALPPPVTPYDYRDRHPVVLTEAPYVLDVFPGLEKGRLDYETERRIRGFVAHYKEFGRGQIDVLTPSGGSVVGVDAVRRTLSSAGLGNVVAVGSYPVVDQRLAAPIRLSFKSLKAKVANQCGEWPQDLASGSSLAGWQNETYWNFGCAQQASLAAQVADPRDLANPRAEEPSDVEMRMRGITKLRSGQDPSTAWGLRASNIGGVGN